jgi:hypothetical protein
VCARRISMPPPRTAYSHRLSIPRWILQVYKSWLSSTFLGFAFG